MLTTVKGIVIRENAFGEKDKYITVLTAEIGKISVICKGARSMKSGNAVPTQLFSYSEFVLYEKKDGYILKEATLFENFLVLRKDITNFALGQYFLELAGEVCTEGDDQLPILRLLLNSLFVLGEGKKSRKQIKASFELRLCAEIGLMPDVGECSVCHTENGNLFWFDILNGNCKCDECFHSAENIHYDSPSVIYQLNLSAIYAIRYVCTCKLEQFFSFVLTDDCLSDFAAFSEKYIINQLGKNFSTLKFYNDLK